MLPLFFLVITGALLVIGLFLVLLTGRPSGWRMALGSGLGILIGAVGVTFCVTAFHFVKTSREERQLAGMSPASLGMDADGVKRFEELNFTLKGLDSSWMELSAASLNSDATFIARNAAQKLTLSVVVERSDVLLTSELLTDVARSNASAQGKLHAWQVLEPVDLGGVKSICIYYAVKTRSVETQTVNIHHFDKGFARQFAVSTTSGISQEALCKAALELSGVFALIDPDRLGGTVNPQEKGARFPEWGCEIGAGGPGWSKVGGENAVRGQIWHGSLHGAAHLLVVPVVLRGGDIDDAALLRGLVGGSTDRAIPENGMSRRKLEIPGADGWEYSYQENIDGIGEYARFIRVIRRGNIAWLVDGGVKADNEVRRTELLQAMDEFRLLPEPESGPPVQPEEFAGQFYNQAGLSYYVRGHYAEARSLFDVASQIRPGEALYLGNAFEALASEGKHSEILSRLEGMPEKLRSTVEMKSHEASALAALGRAGDAMDAYQALFSGGLRNNALLLEASEFMMANGREAQALDLVLKYREAGTNQQLDLVHGRLLSRAGKKEDALAIMKSLHDAAPGNQDVLIEYASALSGVDKKAEALAVIRKAVESTPEDSRMLYQLGYHLADTEKFAEAVEVLENAASLSPKDQTIQGELAFVRSRLGRGHDNEIRVKLEAVPLPPSLAAEPEWNPSMAPADADRLSVRQITVHAFKPGSATKRTIHNDIAVLSSRAVEGLSTLKFQFKPLSERIYVNQLEVMDAEGKVIARGEDKTQYVTSLDDDDATGGKMLCVPVPGLVEGCRLRYQVTYQNRSASDEFAFESTFFGNRYGSVEMAVCMQADEGDFVAKTSGSIQATRDHGYHIWSVKNIPPTPPDSNLPDMELFVPVLYLGPTGTDWKKLGDGYLDDVSKQLTPDPDVESLAKDIVATAKDDGEKIRLLFRWVQREFTYKAIEFGSRARIPHAAGVTCGNRYGDCKDLSVVLHSMMGSVGIPSRLCLVNSSDHVQPDLPSLDQFDHMIVYLPAAGNRPAAWLDPTEKYHAEILQVNPWSEEMNTLVLEEGNSRIETIPALDGASMDRVEFVRELEKGENGAVLVKEVVKTWGGVADGFRSYLLSIPAAERPQRFRELLSGIDSRLSLQDLEINNLQDQDEPLVLEISARADDCAGRDGELKRLPLIWEYDYLRPSPQEGRKTPFSIRRRWQVSGIISGSLPLPGKLRATEASSTGKWGAWSVRGSEKDGSWSVDFTGGVKVQTHAAAEDYPDYVAFWAEGLLQMAEPWLGNN